MSAIPLNTVDFGRALGTKRKTGYVNTVSADVRCPLIAGVSSPRASKLDPFKPKVDALLAEGVRNGAVIVREIHAHSSQAGHPI